jgi:PrtD family type I secretion system ABC transporter
MSETVLERALATCRRAFWGVGAFSLGISLLVLASPIYSLQVYDRVLATQSASTLVVLSVAVVLALAVQAALETIRSLAMVKVGIWLDRALGSELLAAATAIGPTVGEARSAQSLRDLQTLRQFLGGNGLLPLFDAPWVPIFVLVMFLMHPALGWLTLIGGLGALGLAAATEVLTRKPLSEANAAAVRALNGADAVVRNADAIAALGMFADLARRWRAESDRVLDLQEQASLLGSWLAAGSRLLRVLLQTAILGIGAYLAIQGELTGGAMIAASIIAGRALAPIDQAVGSWKAMLAAELAYRRIRSALAGAPARTKTTLPAPEGRLAVEGVVWTPPGAKVPVLARVGFVAAPGEAIGLIGPSGAGKSTLARVLVGSLMPSAGSVRLDGAEMHVWDDRDRGRHVGYLPQDIELFDGTIKENIARFSEASDDEVVAAARLAGAHDLILGLELGYDTPIGTGGLPLSGGQRQRIGLARALFRKPRFVVLDEPNSHLDAAGEQALIEAIVRLKAARCTLVLIAQRMGAIAQMDKILVLQKGAVEMFGPRDEILARVARASGVSDIRQGATKATIRAQGGEG